MREKNTLKMTFVLSAGEETLALPRAELEAEIDAAFTEVRARLVAEIEVARQRRHFQIGFEGRYSLDDRPPMTGAQVTPDS